MKRSLLPAFILLAISSLSAFGASQKYVQSTSLSTSTAITLPSVPQMAQSVIIDVEGSGVRIRDDGTDPTSTVGRPIAAGQSLCYAGDANSVRVIGQTAGATINLTYYAGTCR